MNCIDEFAHGREDENSNVACFDRALGLRMSDKMF